MLKINYLILPVIILLSFSTEVKGQKRQVFYHYTIDVVDTDTVINASLPEVYIFPELKFDNDKEWKEYRKLVRDVKKALPYAMQISQNIIETYEVMETLPDQKSKDRHFKAVQKHIADEYKPKMKKLTKNQGKILVKLIDRQTNSSAYDIVKAVKGSFKATIYNTLAGLYGNNLKTKYDPRGKDQMIERIIMEIRQGTI